MAASAIGYPGPLVPKLVGDLLVTAGLSKRLSSWLRFSTGNLLLWKDP
jgi:hypothetical protein